MAMVVKLIGCAATRSQVLKLLLVLKELAVGLYPARCNPSRVLTLPAPSIFCSKVRLGLLAT